MDGIGVGTNWLNWPSSRRDEKRRALALEAAVAIIEGSNTIDKGSHTLRLAGDFERYLKEGRQTDL